MKGSNVEKVLSLKVGLVYKPLSLIIFSGKYDLISHMLLKF